MDVVYTLALRFIQENVMSYFMALKVEISGTTGNKNMLNVRNKWEFLCEFFS